MEGEKVKAKLFPDFYDKVVEVAMWNVDTSSFYYIIVSFFYSERFYKKLDISCSLHENSALCIMFLHLGKN